jgi:hypothetical protein
MFAGAITTGCYAIHDDSAEDAFKSACFDIPHRGVSSNDVVYIPRHCLSGLIDEARVLKKSTLVRNKKIRSEIIASAEKKTRTTTAPCDLL